MAKKPATVAEVNKIDVFEVEGVRLIVNEINEDTPGFLDRLMQMIAFQEMLTSGSLNIAGIRNLVGFLEDNMSFYAAKDRRKAESEDRGLADYIRRMSQQQFMDSLTRVGGAAGDDAEIPPTNGAN